MSALPFPNTPIDGTVGDLARRLEDARAHPSTVAKLIGVRDARELLNDPTPLLHPSRRFMQKETDHWLAEHPSADVAVPRAPSSIPGALSIVAGGRRGRSYRAMSPEERKRYNEGVNMVLAEIAGDETDSSGEEELDPDNTTNRAVHFLLRELDLDARAQQAQNTFYEDAPPVDVLVNPLLVRGQLSLLVGDGGTGKSMLALGLAYSMTSGIPLVDLPPLEVRQPGAVLYLAGEDDEADLQRRRDRWRDRARQMGQEAGCDYLPAFHEGLARAHVISTAAVPGMCLFGGNEGTDALQALEQLCRSVEGLAALIIDPLSAFASLDFNATDEASRLQTTLRGLAARLGIAVLEVHHVSKAAASGAANGASMSHLSSLGSAQLANGARVVGALRRMTKDEARSWGVAPEQAHERIGLNVTKANSVAGFHEPVWFRMEGGVPVPESALVYTTPGQIKSQIDADKLRQQESEMARSLLSWAESGYDHKMPPSVSSLVPQLWPGAGVSKPQWTAFIHKQIRQGALTLDTQVKASNRSQGCIRPGRIELLRQLAHGRPGREHGAPE